MRIIRITAAYEDGDTQSDIAIAEMITEYGISGYANRGENGLIAIKVETGNASTYNGPKHIIL